MIKETEHIKYGYLCGKCAEELGGVWPKGHCATSHEGKCDCCEEIRGLCHHDDWNWPGQLNYPGRD